MQGPIDTLSEADESVLKEAMTNEFRRAFMAHIQKHKTAFADIVRETGVSRNVLNKLKAREDGSTSVENGMLIAAFYGKTLNEFVAMQEATDESRVRALLQLLTPTERHILESQIKGILNSRQN
jgi:transposase-like protein